MLARLSIRDIVLIERLDIEFSRGLAVLTGETGAGKSILLDAFALAREQLDTMARKIPGSRVLDEAFRQTTRAVAVPPNHPLALAFATKFMTEAISNGTLRKALDHSGLNDQPIRTQTK